VIRDHRAGGEPGAEHGGRAAGQQRRAPSAQAGPDPAAGADAPVENAADDNADADQGPARWHTLIFTGSEEGIDIVGEDEPVRRFRRLIGTMAATVGSAG
jgi:adenosyl cobinamide kinase/adenosyl cobinamide phosphate guanylyltransferase